MMRKLLFATLAMVFLASSAMAANYPDRTITVVIPFGAGGETDIVARVLAQAIEEEAGVTVAPKNIVGAAGMNGCKAVVSAKPDGYTIGIVPSAPLVMHPHMRKLPYELSSFELLGRVTYDPYLVLVHKEESWNDLQAMIADVQANPGKYHWGSSGTGSVPYFAGKNLFASFGLDAKHVPFQGDAGALQAIAAKRVNVYTTTAGVLAKHDLKALAILAPEKSEKLPEIPSVREFGKDVFYSQFLTMIAPKGMPEEVRARLEELVAKAVASEKFVSDIEKLGMTPAYLTAVATKEFVEGEYARNEVTIKQLIEK